ncbi:hypothetical protein [Butyrivibrio sp. INlla16]|uniref:hypothetical protein n=1 Tax=Butyrivibrio sp. INlla16 TaxID=1520807 RepID=UPI000888CD1B|nr:hypothetical protein [Butyrivibrio sp. INlla16]SDB19752.1 hypothetical protein SAMN02910263_00955 [Butyrivibrio sp. INlla16]
MYIDYMNYARVREFHLLILVAWIIPYFSILDFPQLITPFFVTLGFIIYDLVKSKGYFPYNKYVITIIWTNLVGIALSTAIYVSGYVNDPYVSVGPEMGLFFAGIMDAIYLVLLAVCIAGGFIILFVKNKMA